MGALADNFAFFQNQNLVSMENGADSLCHDDHGAVLHLFSQCLSQSRIGFQIQCGEAVVKDEHFRVLGNGSGDSQTLFLSAGNIGTALCNGTVKPVGLLLDKFHCLCNFRRLLYFCIGSVRIAEPQVAGNGTGEQQKLSFIRALVFDPAFVIVDETLSNLDPDSTELFEQLMREQQTKNKMTWLLISHQLVHVRKICDQVHFMEQGNVLVSGTPEEILLHPSHPSIRRYLADTEVSYRENEKNSEI